MSSVRRSAALALVATVGLATVAIGVIASGRGGADVPNERASIGTLRLRTIDGDTVRRPGGRPGALFFSVSFCLSCLPSAQALGEIKRQAGDRIDAAWVSMDPGDSPQALRERRRMIGDPPYPFTIDTSGTLAERFGITSLGTTIVYDRAGRIVARLTDAGTAQLEEAFAKAGATVRRTSVSGAR